MAWIALVATWLFVAGMFNKRTRSWFIKLESHKDRTLPEVSESESESLRNWKAVFRETVAAVDGQLSPELENFLLDDATRASKILEAAKAEAEKERQRIIEEARQEILAETQYVKNSRPLLVGAAYEEFKVDYSACDETPGERWMVIRRWHERGFRFPVRLREHQLRNATDSHVRDLLRALYDEQDRPDAVEREPR